MKVAHTLRDNAESPSKATAEKKTAPRCAVYLMYLALSVRFILISDAHAETFALDAAVLSNTSLTASIVADAAYMERTTKRGVNFVQGLMTSLHKSIDF